MSKVRIILFLALLALGCGVAYGAMLGKTYVTPESFGAKGDGNTDDSNALTKCFQTGKSVRFSSGKSYLLKTPIRIPNSESFHIDGNGARLIIHKDYALKENCAIFYFVTPRKSLITVENLDIACQLGQKFPKKEVRGDTYIFLVSSCDQVVFRNVKFKSEENYNNVTFLRVNGSRKLYIDHCNIVLNTLSVQGGILWLMNREDSQCSVSIKDSYFEHDVKDECMCFSVYKDYEKTKCEMNVEVDNCNFYSKGESPSSGFILVYANSKKAYSNIDVKYKNCSFKTDGEYLRRIQGYQICPGDSDYDYGVFHTIYDQCKFDFKFKSLKTTGILGILYSKGTSMPSEAISYIFKDCEFSLKNVSPMIDDNKSIRNGTYEFVGCSFVSDGDLFTKKNQPSKGNVWIKLENCDLKSKDSVISTESIIARKCRFTNNIKAPLHLNNSKIKVEGCTINGILYK